MDIAIDFDGTCVKQAFPLIGEDIGAVPVLKKLIANGHRLILNTIRCDIENGAKYLTEAINWFQKNDIQLYGIQKNPTQHTWTTSPKVYAEMYIDDAALGCPLWMDIVKDGDEGIKPVSKPYVNWQKIEEMLIDKGIISDE